MIDRCGRTTEKGGVRGVRGVRGVQFLYPAWELSMTLSIERLGNFPNNPFNPTSFHQLCGPQPHQIPCSPAARHEKAVQG